MLRNVIFDSLKISGCYIYLLEMEMEMEHCRCIAVALPLHDFALSATRNGLRVFRLGFPCVFSVFLGVNTHCGIRLPDCLIEGKHPEMPKNAVA